MEDTRNITSKVREAMPDILQQYEEGLSFNQLMEELYDVFGKEMLDSNCNLRDGVLRGITNKIKDKPIKNVVYEKVGTRNIFRYVDNVNDELDREIERFLRTLSDKGLLAVDVLSIEESKLDSFYKKQAAILALKGALEN